MNDDQLLEKFGKLIDQKLDPLNKRLDNTATKQDIAGVQTDIAQVHTIVEAVKAGQDDIRESNIRIEQKIDKVAKDVKSDRERIDNLEEHAGVSNPHKH